MKIVHLCLSCFYIDGFSYQENELVAQNIADGHEVFVIASTETYGVNRELIYIEPDEYVGLDGAHVIRLPYKGFLPKRLLRKFRAHPNVLEIIEGISPDVILFHGLCGYELLTVSKYKREHPEVKLYADSHEDFNNSGKSFFSRYFLHYAFYRLILLRCLDAIDKVFCVSVDTINFVRDFYGVPTRCIEFFPLGGNIFEDKDYENLRCTTRQQLKASPNEIIFIQTGKIDRTKKLIESLHSFILLNDPKSYFFIAGHLQDDIFEEVHNLLSVNSRIRFLGWKAPDELRALLCAADVYVQPGTQSATMQMSLCCRCAVILDDVPSHHPFIDGNGWLVGDNLTLEEAFQRACEGKNHLSDMAEKSAQVAAHLLDYRKLAARLYR